MNPFKAGDVVEITINEKDCHRPPRLAVVTFSLGPLIEAEYVEGADKYFGSYIYARLPPE